MRETAKRGWMWTIVGCVFCGVYASVAGLINFLVVAGFLCFIVGYDYIFHGGSKAKY